MSLPHSFLGFFFVLAGVLLSATCALAGPPSPASNPLRVAIHEKPPYAIKNQDGSWAGLAPSLWMGVSKIAGIDYEFVEVPYEDVIQGVSAGDFDAGAGESEVTPAAERMIDFALPYLNSSITAAFNPQDWKSAWLAVRSDLLNPTIAKLVAGIVAIMLVVSVLIWAVERHHDARHFAGGLRGIGSALWFSAVTMTTVGYGDKTPATFAGRFIAFLWMLGGVVLVSGFTASVTSSLSAARLSNSLQNIADFQEISCGVLKDSEAAGVLKTLGVTTHEYESIEAALEDLHARRIEAVIEDRYALAYALRSFSRQRPPKHFELARFNFRESFIAVPFRNDHPDYRRFNDAVLEFTQSTMWADVQRRWLGGAAAP